MDISSLLEVEVNEEEAPIDNVVDKKPKVNPLRPSEIISPEEEVFYQNLYGDDLAQVRFKKHHCTSCDTHIGSAPCDVGNMYEHPVLKTLLCELCREFYGDGTFEQGDDATDMFCRWCANGGNLYCCSFCSNTFCSKCIRRNLDVTVQDKIEADEKWKCFVCDPTDLYLLRSNCRALLEHVKTLSRILLADRSLTPKDIEIKMEQDDSMCCPKRGKRKRKNSSSEEWKEDYKSSKRKRNGSTMKRRRLSAKDPEPEIKDKKNVTVLNGTNKFIPISPAYVLQELVPSPQKPTEEEDLPPPLFQCEQTMIEGDSTSSTFNLPKGVPNSILTNKAISLNTVQRNVIRPPSALLPPNRYIPIRPLRKVDSIPPGTRPQIIHKLPPRTQLPMVTIPAMGAIMNNNIKSIPVINSGQPVQQKGFIRCKSNLTAEPATVINIDSDPEDLMIVEHDKTQKKKTEVVNESSSKRVSPKPPVITSIQQQNTKEIFDETIDNPIKKIDELLSQLRERLRVDLVKVGEWPEEDVSKAWRKVNIINQNINRVVNELAALNNSVVKQYRPWKKQKEGSNDIHDGETNPIVLGKSEKSSKYISLVMECIGESEPEDDDDCDLIDDNDIDKIPDFSVRIINVDKKEMINQSTSTKVETKDQSIQVFENYKIDYDKSISYSLLMKAEYDSKKNKEVFKPAIVHDEYYGKFEEEFINYLQSFEDHRNDVLEDVEEDDETELVEIIKNDLTKSLEKTSNNLECLEEFSEKSKLPEVNETLDQIPLLNSWTNSGDSETFCNLLTSVKPINNDINDANKKNSDLIDDTLNEAPISDSWASSGDSQTFRDILKSVNPINTDAVKINDFTDDLLNPAKAPDFSSWTSLSENSNSLLINSVNDVEKSNNIPSNLGDQMEVDTDLDGESNDQILLSQTIRNDETANAVRALISEESSNSCGPDHQID